MHTICVLLRPSDNTNFQGIFDMVFPQLGRAYLMKSSAFIVTLLLLSFSYATNAHVETPNNKATLWFEQSDLPLNEKLHVKVLDNGRLCCVIQTRN
jgi:zinc protease